MPIQASGFQLPSGARAVRADCTGIVTKEEAAAWMGQQDPGQPFHGLPILAITLHLDKVTADARGLFSRHGDRVRREEVWTAVVITNPLIRVTTNFVFRIAGTKKQRIFATEQEAVAWLDERVREDAAPRAAP
jgi:hypothetical protein